MLGSRFARALLLSLGLCSAAAAAEVPTSDTGHTQNPQWSPDGRWLAFEINNMSNSVELWLVQVNAGQPGSPNQLRIPGAASSFGGGGYMAASPTWVSAPSQMVVFEGSNPGGSMRLYYATPGAGVPNELITSTQLKGNLASPAVSADGKRFAFVSDATGNGDVYLWDVGGSGAISPVATTAASENSPAFNAKGDRLAFSRKNQGNEDLFVWDGGDTAAPLKGGSGDQTRPRWSGDDVVYFTGERGEGLWDIAVMSGGNKKVVAKDVRLPSRASPALTPDGAAVVWTSSDPERGDRIMITRLDGSATSEIKTGLVAAAEPALVTSNGRVFLAFTALPAKGADWRTLHVIDITGQY